MFKELIRIPSRAALLLILSFVLIGLYGCEPFLPHEQEALDRVPRRLVVVTTIHPLTHYIDANKQVWGIDSELLSQWAQEYSLNLVFKRYRTREEAQRAFTQGQGDILAARLPTLNHGQKTLSGPALEESYLSLFCLKTFNIDNVKDLAQKRVLIRPFDQSAMLQKRLLEPQREIKVIPAENMTGQQMAKSLIRKKSDCMVMENLEGDRAIRSFLAIEKITKITDNEPISWWVRDNRPEVVTLMQIWFHRANRSGKISQVLDRYQTMGATLDHLDLRRFYQNSKRILPRYLRYFKEAATEFNIPWQMLAAVAYQESHWNPKAKSFTGVKGLMQITQETAQHLGISDREDPQESIFGGAKYLKILLAMQPNDLNWRDRWSLALAAYNIGYGHLLDAQKLAQQKDLNPLSWSDIKTVLPLLAETDFCEQLEYGCARGHETVLHLNQTRAFYRLLVLND